MKEYPFQVIYSDHLYATLSGDSIFEKDFVSINETLVVEEGGYGLLMHATGAFVALESSSRINIKSASDSILNYLDLTDGALIDRIPTELLFLEYTKYRYKHGISADNYHPPMAEIRIVVPADSRNKFGVSQSNPQTCLAWELIDAGKQVDSYTIKVVSVFNEVLAEFETTNQQFLLDFSQIPNESGLYVVSIFTEEENIRSNEIAFEKVHMTSELPTICPADTPEKALEMAIYLERNSEYCSSTWYYELATKLSKEPIYDILLDNYLKRKAYYGKPCRNI